MQKSRIVKAISTCFTKCNHKYDIQVPYTIEEAFQLDKESGTDLWHGK